MCSSTPLALSGTAESIMSFSSFWVHKCVEYVLVVGTYIIQSRHSLCLRSGAPPYFALLARNTRNCHLCEHTASSIKAYRYHVPCFHVDLCGRFLSVQIELQQLNSSRSFAALCFEKSQCVDFGAVCCFPCVAVGKLTSQKATGPQIFVGYVTCLSSLLNTGLVPNVIRKKYYF